jgi:hypothetical protein
MTVGRPSQRLFVDAVLGWTAQIGETDGWGAGSARADRRRRLFPAAGRDAQAAEGGAKDEERPGDRLYPSSGR